MTDEERDWDVVREMRDVLKWGPVKISRWIIPLIFAFHCGAQQWYLCVCVIARVCVCTLYACMCVSHSPLKSSVQGRKSFSATWYKNKPKTLITREQKKWWYARPLIWQMGRQIKGPVHCRLSCVHVCVIIILYVSLSLHVLLPLWCFICQRAAWHIGA